MVEDHVLCHVREFLVEIHRCSKDVSAHIENKELELTTFTDTKAKDREAKGLDKSRLTGQKPSTSTV